MAASIQSEKAKQKRYPMSTGDSAQLSYLLYIDFVNGLTIADIKKKLEGNLYEGYETAHYSKTHHYRLIQNGYSMAKEILEEERHKQRELMYNRVTAVYADSMQHGDRGNALKALDQLAKLAGLYEQKLKVDNNVSGEVTISFGFEGERGEGEKEKGEEEEKGDE